MSFICLHLAQVDIALAAAHKRAEPPILARQLQVPIHAIPSPVRECGEKELQRVMHRAPALGAAEGAAVRAMDGLTRHVVTVAKKPAAECLGC